MNRPFWCVLGWVGFGVMSVGFWCINRLLTQSHEREKQWDRECKRVVKLATKTPIYAKHWRN